MGVEYNTEDGIIKAALVFSKTIIPEVLEDKEFWLLLFMNLTVRTLRDQGIITPEEIHIDLPFYLTGVTGSLMTFFVCFYNGHQFGRYNRLYDLTQSLSENVLELCTKLRVELPDDRNLQRKIAKLTTASVIMFYLERTGGGGGGGADGKNGKISRQEFYQLWRLGLLDEEEIRALRRHCRHLREDSVAAFLVLQWAMELLMGRTEDPPSREDMLSGFLGQMYKIRSDQAMVTQVMELPMPFQYFHIMNFMLMLNLVLWAYSLACQDSLFAPIIYAFVQLMFQGIRELSTSLADPFGDDDVDFAINEWMVSLFRRVHSIVEDDWVDTVQDTNPHLFMPPIAAAQKIDAHVDYYDPTQSEIGGLL